ncbi:hypothetical protein N9N71_00225 [Synechococcus sp. AH-229-G18]|nr:hypothetical protein [Synechococcus sp. AH-229-G18]
MITEVLGRWCSVAITPRLQAEITLSDPSRGHPCPKGRSVEGLEDCGSWVLMPLDSIESNSNV